MQGRGRGTSAVGRVYIAVDLLTLPAYISLPFFYLYTQWGLLNASHLANGLTIPKGCCPEYHPRLGRA